MAEDRAEFYDRLAAIERQRSRLSKGSVRRIGEDGLIRAYPRYESPRFPLKGILIVIAAGIGFKALLLTQLGPVTYQARVDKLAAGSVIEQGGAILMQIDPVTAWVSAQIQPYL